MPGMMLKVVIYFIVIRYDFAEIENLGMTLFDFYILYPEWYWELLFILCLVYYTQNILGIAILLEEDRNRLWRIQQFIITMTLV